MLRQSFLLLFHPSQFVELATQQAIEHEFASNMQFRERYSDRIVPSDTVEQFRRTAGAQTDRIRRALLGGVLWTSGTMLLGVGIGVALSHWFGPPSKFLIYGFQAVGAAVILGATLGEIGRDIQTWDGGTLPERVNAWTFRSLYVVGTFLFMASFSWDAAS